jgi:hypothetical protein
MALAAMGYHLLVRDDLSLGLASQGAPVPMVRAAI